MASENYNEQLKWFTQKLREIRRSQEGFDSSIDFDPALISTCVTPCFDSINRTPEECVTQMLREIRGFLKKEKLITIDEAKELFWTKKGNGNIEIEGFTTELLNKFFEKKFGESPCLFREGRSAENKIILNFNGENTNVLIRGNSLAVFRCLLENFNKDVTYEELFDAIRVMKTLTQGQPSTHTVTEAEKRKVHSAVGELKEKLDEATGFRGYSEIIENVRGEGYRMVM